MNFACLECGRKFRSTRAAEKAANNGCPKCGGVDIDLDTDFAPERKKSDAFEKAYAAHKSREGSE